MKKSPIIFIAVGLLILIPLGMWWFSEDHAIKRHSNHLMRVLTIHAGTSAPVRHAKVFSINGVLAPKLEISSPDIQRADGTFDKVEIESAFSWICRNAKESKFGITEFVEIKIDGERATVNAVVEGFMELGGSRPVDGTFDVTLHWVKIDGSWRLEKMVWNNF